MPNGDSVTSYETNGLMAASYQYINQCDYKFPYAGIVGRCTVPVGCKGVLQSKLYKANVLFDSVTLQLGAIAGSDTPIHSGLTVDMTTGLIWKQEVTVSGKIAGTVAISTLSGELQLQGAAMNISGNGHFEIVSEGPAGAGGLCY